jgi:AbrB family looped-hinge helix DNA binding protein
MSTATLTSKSQITLPKRVRDELGVGPGDRIDFVRLEDGNFAIVPATHSVKSLKGILGKRAKPITLEEMDAAIVKGARGE